MSTYTWFLAAVGFCVSASSVSAQAPTTVQLPTFQVFSVNTTVSVPDGGGALLGGINRAADSSTTRGLPLGSKIPGLGRLAGNRGIGSTRSASNMSVHATIIDHQELDAAVLAEAAARRGSLSLTDKQEQATQQKAAYISRNLARVEQTVSETKPAAPSVEDIRRRNELAAANRDAEEVVYFAKAQAAEAEQKPGVAKIYYQMVARRAAGDLRSQAETRLAALSSPTKSLAAK